MEQKCEQNLAPFTNLLDQLGEAILITDSRLEPPGPMILYVNSAWEQMTGYSAKDVVGRPSHILHGEETSEAVVRKLREDLKQKGFAKSKMVSYRRDGTPYHVVLSVSAITFQDVDATCYLAVERDANKRHMDSMRQRQLEALTRIQRAAATGSLNFGYVRQRIAEVAMEVSGADAAVVEEVEGTEMVYRAVAGIAREYMGMRLPIEASASGQAYNSRESIQIRDVAEDDRINREAAQKVGFESGIIVPLIHENRAYGVLKVYAGEPNRFTAEDLQLLELASGVLAANLRRAAEYASEERRRGMLLDSLPALVAYVDKDLRYQEVNAAYESFHGAEPQTLRGKYLPDVLIPSNYDRLHPYLTAVLAGESVNFEVALISGEGSERMMAGTYKPHFGVEGEVIGFYKIIQDITEQQEAHIDYLTGLVNRREFERLGGQLLATAQRYDKNLGLIMVDLDYFKRINDDFGHLKGDEVLRATAQCISGRSREADVAGRWGGEEFVLLLPETDEQASLEVAERIRSAIAEHDYGVGRSVTASLGVTTAGARDSLESIQNRVDQALYSAKKNGRNQVVLK